MSQLRDPLSGRVHGPVWIVLSAVITGAATFVTLIILARALGPVLYADFAVFWSFLVIASFGVFLPLEQEVARRTAGDPQHLKSIARTGLGVGGIYAVLVLLVGNLLWHMLLSHSVPNPAVVAAIVLLCGASAAQFAARGLLSGRLALRGYAIVVTVDAVVRLAMVGLLAAVGATSVGSSALAIAGSCCAAAAVAWVEVFRLKRPEQAGHSGAVEQGMLLRTSGLVVGALCMQALLNSGPLIARSVSSSDGEIELAGHLLAVMTLARVPVFILQAMQATYLARVAGHARRHEISALRRTLALLTSLVAGLVVLTILAAAIIGPWLVRVVYGPSFVVTREATVLVAAGVALYVVASVANDVNVALGRHPRIALAWSGALLAGAVAVVLSDTLLLKATLPLIVAALLAAMVLVAGVVRAIRRMGA
jgi:O-antigen/teichoic acid export membrane protein